MPPQQAVNTQAGARLIKDFEGFRPDAYPEPKDGWPLPTIAYGTTAYANAATEANLGSILVLTSRWGVHCSSKDGCTSIYQKLKLWQQKHGPPGG